MLKFYVTLLSAAAIGMVGMFSNAIAQTQEPTGDDQRRVLGATNLFLRALSVEDFSGAYRRLDPALAEILSTENAAQLWAGYVEQGIEFENVTPRALTWYADPQGLPEGLYAAVDIGGSSAAVPVVCGYIIFRVAETYPTITRIELSTIDAATFDQITDANRATALAQLGCR
jgi:hypothetical protein